MRDIWTAEVDELESAGLLPARREAVFIAGSVALGWNNSGSDLDVYVICDSAPAAVEGVLRVGLVPDHVPKAKLSAGPRTIDVEYWRDSQVDQLLDKVSWERIASDQIWGDRLGGPELRLLERLAHAVAVDGADWLSRRQTQIRATGLRSLVVSRFLLTAELAIDDARGQLDSGDVESAVLSARAAFGSCVDALLAGEGQLGQNGKWRARRFRAVAPVSLSFEDYWAIETMRDFDAANPGDWVRRVIGTCRRIARDVVV